MTTLQHLMDDHSQDEQTSFQPGSLANLTALQENVWRSVTSVIYGAKSCEFWGKRNPDGSWEKTSQDSLALNLDDSSGEWSMTWPKWGIALDGAVMELATLAQSTGGTAYSSLLGTPTTNDAKNSLTESQRGRRTLTADLLPTPRAQCAKAPSRHGQGGPGFQDYLLLPTPRAGKMTSESRESWEKKRDEGKVSAPPLALSVQMLPTPQAFDSMTFKKGDLTDKTTKNGKKGGRSNLREANGTHGITLVAAIGDALDVATGGGGVLNPYFVQKMMGFPTGWLD